MTLALWMNGSMADPAQARVPVTDHGLTVGDGAFETLRTQRGVPFATRRHLHRLRASLRGLGLSCPYGDGELAEAMAAVARRVREETGQPGGEARIRVTVTGGSGPLGSSAATGPATVVVAAQPFEPVEPTTAVVTLPWARNEHSPLTGLKTTSYAENVVALGRARAAGASEGLWLNTAGQLCEGTGTNVFLVVDGAILTPPLSSGCLAGITRALVCEVADVVERDLDPAVLETAEEVFLTSSTRDVQGVHRLDDRELPAPGPVTAATARAFAALAAADPDP